MSDKDTRIATTQREQKAPTLEQFKPAINTMPTDTDLERRDRALISFFAKSGLFGAMMSDTLLRNEPFDFIDLCGLHIQQA